MYAELLLLMLFVYYLPWDMLCTCKTFSCICFMGKWLNPVIFSIGTLEDQILEITTCVAVSGMGEEGVPQATALVTFTSCITNTSK